MKITGARIACGPVASERRDFAVRGGFLRFEYADQYAEPVLDLRGFLVLPGLINAHDHLEFNLFPLLAHGSYGNSKEWADDIHQPSTSPVKEHLEVSRQIRLTWGGLKNLLSGVTTVAHHNSCEDPLFNDDFLVNVVKRFGWAHSLDFSPDLISRFKATPEDWPFIVHAAEGVDQHARSECRRLDELGVLTGRTVLVHAIGLDQPDLDLMEARRSSIVWCPSSNLALFGQTISEATLQSDLHVVLGTDSAMTAQTDLIDEIAVARRTRNLSANELYEMVTSRPAQLLRLNEGQGTICHGGVADVIAVEDRDQSPAQALEDMRLELVIVSGKIRLISPRLRDRIADSDWAPMHSIRLEGRDVWLTDVDVPALHRETAAVLGGEYRLAGRRISV